MTQQKERAAVFEAKLARDSQAEERSKLQLALVELKASKAHLQALQQQLGSARTETTSKLQDASEVHHHLREAHEKLAHTDAQLQASVRREHDLHESVAAKDE